MNELKIVDGRMTTLAFAEMTGTEHSNVLRKARKLLKDLGIDEPNFGLICLDGQNKERPMLSLDKNLSLILAGQYEPKIAYHVIQSLNSQEPRPKQAVEVHPVREIAPLSQTDSILALQVVANDLNLSQSGRIKVYAIGMQAYPNFVKALSVCVVDAPVVDDSIESNTIGSSSSALAIRDHLKNHGVDLSAKAFNEILVSEGYLEVKHRRSSSSRAVSGWKSYKSVTKKGLEFGKNVTSTRAQRETDPHWYSDKILELFEILGVPTHSS